MDRIPAFDELITEEWFNKGMENGNFVPGHGSDIGQLVADIQQGVTWLPTCPDHLKNVDTIEASDDPEMRAVVWSWLEKRYAEVIDNLPKGEQLKLYRIMRVDDDWIDNLKTGEVTTGIYFSDDPYVDGGFWLDEEKPNEIRLDVTVNRTDVDWHGTILARMDYMTGDPEAEIRMKTDAPVMVNSFSDDDDAYEIRKLLSTGQHWVKDGTPSFAM